MFSRMLRCFITVAIGVTLVCCDKYANRFDSIYGCKQTNAVNNYNHPIEFISTKTFENAGAGFNSTFFRIGIFGKQDGIIRLADKALPYNKDTLHEIVIGFNANKNTEVRRQVRNNLNHHRNHVLTKIPTPNILSEFQPFVMTIEFLAGGTVQLTRDGETVPFLEFSDPEAEIHYSYIGFANGPAKVVHFFDCPTFNFDVRMDNLKF